MPRTRPEIYAMGFRNPFRFAVDRTSGAVYVGDYSPDSNQASRTRGPAGHGRWMLIRQPGNYGWPYCVTRDIGYVDYDFATGASGEEFNCNRPVNESPNNTGRRTSSTVGAGRISSGRRPSTGIRCSTSGREIM